MIEKEQKRSFLTDQNQKDWTIAMLHTCKEGLNMCIKEKYAVKKDFRRSLSIF